MSGTKHPRTKEIGIAAIIIVAVASSIVIAYNWQSIFPSKYPIALSNILFSTNKQIESVSIGIKTRNASQPITTNWITLNTTGLQPLASPLSIPQGGKFATSDYITATTYSIDQAVVIDRTSNTTQEQLTITITSKMLQYTSGYTPNYYVTLQKTRTGYAVAIPTNATWSALSLK